jgi:hypothetical protein
METASTIKRRRRLCPLFLRRADNPVDQS